MSEPIYNKIGIGYNNNRTVDPYIADRIINNLLPTKNGKYLDVGCGTANYTHYLANKGFTFYGVDPSEVMLATARLISSNVIFNNASAEKLPFPNNFFNGVIAILTIHHWKDIRLGLHEIERVLQHNSKFVIFSFTGEQMDGYWLKHYFPEMIENAGTKIIPTQKEMFELLHNAGFQNIKTEKYFIQNNLQDKFLYAYKNQPEKYLDENVRKGSSGFSKFCTTEELNKGLHLLANDITSGEINNIIKKYENDKGDYLFYIATKT